MRLTGRTMRWGTTRRIRRAVARISRRKTRATPIRAMKTVAVKMKIAGDVDRSGAGISIEICSSRCQIVPQKSIRMPAIIPEQIRMIHAIFWMRGGGSQDRSEERRVGKGGEWRRWAEL